MCDKNENGFITSVIVIKKYTTQWRECTFDNVNFEATGHKERVRALKMSVRIGRMGPFPAAFNHRERQSFPTDLYHTTRVVKLLCVEQLEWLTGRLHPEVVILISFGQPWRQQYRMLLSCNLLPSFTRFDNSLNLSLLTFKCLRSPW